MDSQASSNLIATVVGGVIAVVGGFGGAWFIRWRDDVRADREREGERVGRISVLISELAENHTNLELRLGAAQTSRLEVRDDAYRESQTFIARELKPETWEALHKAYGPLRSPNYLYGVYTPAPGKEQFVINHDRAVDLLADLEAAAAALREERGPWPKK